MNCIEVKNITKNYGNVCALKDVCLKFEQNKIYGLLGRNGAGKSTLLNIITNRIFPDSGVVLIDGDNALENDNVLQRLYLMSETNYFPEGMRIKKIFEWTKEFYPNFDRTYAETLSKKFELDINKKVKALSTGYSSIFKLILTLSSNAPYLLFDEPILGLDANHRDMFYKVLIEKYMKSPCTIVISTHLIEEVASIIEDVVIIKNGEIIKNESLEELISDGYTISGSASVIDLFIKDKNVLGMDSVGGLKTAYILGHYDQIEVPDGAEVTKMDLQKLFIELTNK